MTYQPVRHDQHTAFDELFVAEATTSVQLQFPYNINTGLIEARENNAGTVTQADGMAVMQSGASANSAAHLLSKVPLKYEPGQGALVRFTALFTTGVSNSVQLAGIGEVGDGLFFGFNGDTFSILRREKGKPEVQTLTITNGATTAGGTITITLDGDAREVEIANSDTAREVAVKVANADWTDVGLGWTAYVHNATVILKAWSDGNKAGTMSFADTDTTGVAASLAETIAGVSTTNEWVAQASWNEDVADSTATLPTLDPTKGNVYQIRYQWLGYGLLSFFIEDPVTGEMVVVHTIRYANANTSPSLQNPTLPLHIMSKNNSNTSNLTVKTSSMAGFTEGKVAETALLHGASASITNLATTELPVLSIKNNIVYQSAINRVRMQPEFITLATESSKPVVFRVRLQPTLTGPVAFTAFDASLSVASVDVAATGVSGGREVFTITLGKTDSEIIAVSALRKRLNPGEQITITAEAVSGSSQEVTVGINWNELF